MIAWNDNSRRIRGYPENLLTDGASFEDLMRYDVQHDEFGPGDPEKIIQEKIATAQRSEVHSFERQRPDGTHIDVRGGPIESGGLVSTFTYITERK